MPDPNVMVLAFNTLALGVALWALVYVRKQQREVEVAQREAEAALQAHNSAMEEHLQAYLKASAVVAAAFKRQEEQSHVLRAPACIITMPVTDLNPFLCEEGLGVFRLDEVASSHGTFVDSEAPQISRRSGVIQRAHCSREASTTSAPAHRTRASTTE